MGAIDAQGVWIYDNSDHVVPISTYENLGQNSISAALLDLRNDLTPANVAWTNTGITWNASWESFGATSGASGYVRYCRIGTVVYLSGLARILVSSSGASPATLTMLTMPAGFRPAYNTVTLGYMNLDQAGSGVTTGAASTGTAHTHAERSGPSCRINMNPDGTIQMVRNIGHQLQLGDWVALGGISYPV